MSTNHHYLPKFYLNGFVDNIEKLHYYRKQYKTYKDINTSGIYYEKDLNNVHLGDYGNIDLETEFFQDRDNSYAQAFQDMRLKYNYDVSAIPVQTKADIVEFVLGLYWRVPGALKHVTELIDNDGLLTGELKLYHKESHHVYSDEEIPEIISDIKSKIENQKFFMTFFYVENVRKHDWSKIDNKFLIFKTNEPLLIGDIPYVPLKTECKRGKILEEFIIPLDRNHLLIYADKKPCFLEATLFHFFNLCIIDGASEKISCSNKEYLINEINDAKIYKQHFEILGINDFKQQLLQPFLVFQSQFQTFEEFQQYYNNNEFDKRSKVFFEKYS